VGCYECIAFFIALMTTGGMRLGSGGPPGAHLGRSKSMEQRFREKHAAGMAEVEAKRAELDREIAVMQ
jgi:hypothetical protein